MRRPRDELPKLTASAPRGQLLLDTNVFINGLAGRLPSVLEDLLKSVDEACVAAPTRAELAWVRGRLNPEHPGTKRLVANYDDLLARMAPTKILIPDDTDWLAAGELAGRAARALAGGGDKIATAFDRVELISDALIATVAHRTGLTVITEDAHFDLLARLLPGLNVLFYDRPGP